MSLQVAVQGALLRPLHGLAVQRPLRAGLLDDVAFDRRRLIRACARAGIIAEFAEAASLAEFRGLLKTQVFDLLFIDYRLPDGDGLAALDLVMADPAQSDAATIMIAGEADAAVAVEALKAGCSDYLGKADITPTALQRAVTSAVEKAALRREIGAALGLHDALRQTVGRLAAAAGSGLRTELEALIVAAGRGADPAAARRLRAFLDEVASYGPGGGH